MRRHADRIMICIIMMLSIYASCLNGRLFLYPVIWISVMLVIFLALLFYLHEAQRMTVCLFVFTLMIFLCAFHAERMCGVYTFVDSRQVTSIRGTAVSDSHEGGYGQYFVSLDIDECFTVTGMKGSASGCVTAVVKEHPVRQGMVIRCDGSFRDDGTFRAKSYSVLEFDDIWKIRVRMLEKLESIFSDSELGMLLVLGKDPGGKLRDDSIRCGISHLLALSGMHLSFMITAISFIPSLYLPRRLCRFLAVPSALVFAFMIGNRPSLTRALFVSIVSIFVPDSDDSYMHSLGLAWCMQLVLFPCSIRDLGFILSYLALCGIMLTGRANVFSASFYAMAAAFPVTSYISETVSLSSIWMTAAGTVIISMAMAGALLHVLGFPYLLDLASRAYSYLLLHEPILVDSAQFPLIAAIVLTILLVLRYSSIIACRIRRKRYELEFSVRQSVSDNLDP